LNLFKIKRPAVKWHLDLLRHLFIGEVQLERTNCLKIAIAVEPERLFLNVAALPGSVIRESCDAILLATIILASLLLFVRRISVLDFFNVIQSDGKRETLFANTVNIRIDEWSRLEPAPLSRLSTNIETRRHPGNNLVCC
jgi:hypothetical protein